MEYINPISKYFYNESVLKKSKGLAIASDVSLSISTMLTRVMSGTYASRYKKLSQRELGVANEGENYNAEPVSNKILLVHSAMEAINLPRCKAN